MVEVDYLLICEGVSHDASGKVSLMNIFDIIGSDKLPVAPPQFVIAMQVRNSDEKVQDAIYDLKLEIQKPDKSILATIEGQAVFSESIQTVASSINLSNNLVMEHEGKYEINLLIKSQKIASRVFSVKKGKPEVTVETAEKV